jgi:hypothetical protein
VKALPALALQPTIAARLLLDVMVKALVVSVVTAEPVIEVWLS